MDTVRKWCAAKKESGKKERERARETLEVEQKRESDDGEHFSPVSHANAFISIKSLL